MLQASSETSAASVDTHACRRLWLLGRQERALPWACRSSHSSSASFLFHIVPEGSRCLLCTLEGQSPSTPEVPHLPLSHSLTTPAVCPLVRRMSLKYVCSGQVSEGSQSSESQVFTAYWRFALKCPEGNPWLCGPVTARGAVRLHR